MRILYDDLGFVENHGGVSRLFTEVMKNLPEGFSYALTPVATTNAYLSKPPFNLPRPQETVHDFVRKYLHGKYIPGISHVYKNLARIFPWKFPSYELYNERARCRAFSGGNFDIAHLTVPHPFNHYWKSLVGRKPIIATVVDLIPELFNNDQRVTFWRRKLLKEATHIIAITERTKSDVVKMYNVPPEKISVVYLGANMKSTARQSSELVHGRFVLFVGKRGGYKNFNWLLSALAPILRDGLTLFCTGSPFTSEEHSLFKKLGVEGRVVQKFVTDEEMNWLFAHAECFIHPSLYEGFGIPILDAFAAGCPALIANASCFPEVAGDAALYFDPTEETSLINAFSALRLPGARERLVAKGRARLKMFSWTKCAEETAEVYRRVLEDDAYKI